MSNERTKEILTAAGFGIVANRLDSPNFARELASQPLDGINTASNLDAWLAKKLEGSFIEKFHQFANDPEIMAKESGTTKEELALEFYHVNNPSAPNTRSWWWVKFINGKGETVRKTKAHGHIQRDENGEMCAMYNLGVKTTPEDTTPEGWAERVAMFSRPL